MESSGSPCQMLYQGFFSEGMVVGYMYLETENSFISRISHLLKFPRMKKKTLGENNFEFYAV